VRFHSGRKVTRNRHGLIAAKHQLATRERERERQEIKQAEKDKREEDRLRKKDRREEIELRIKWATIGATIAGIFVTLVVKFA
jgi:multidrug resistance efflux pump